MTTDVVRVVDLSRYAIPDDRLKSLESYSRNAHRRRPNYSIEHWTLDMFYYLLLDDYKMPRDQVVELIAICQRNNVTVLELGALLDEELFEKLGNTLPDRTMQYVSLAILEKMVDKSGYGATKKLKRELVPSKTKRLT